jgi:hypothetical protein
MLFLVEGEFIEVLRENTYEGIYTFCAPKAEALEAVARQTIGEVIELHGQNHKFAVHVPEDRSNDLIKDSRLTEVDVVNPLTGPPVAYGFDYVRESEMQKDGALSGDYGYCWPEEIEQVKERLYTAEDPADGEVYFVPLWEIPEELKKSK